jgi:type VI protein secretion system component Hcp
MQALHFVAQLQKASTKLFSARATGQHIKQAVLSGAPASGRRSSSRSSSPTSSFPRTRPGGSSQDGASPTDQVRLSFAKIALSQRSLDEKGQLGAWVTSSFDVKSIKPA